MSFLVDTAANVLANLLFWFGLGGIFWLLARTGRRRFLRFFGVERDRSLTAYLSNLGLPTGDRRTKLLISGHEFLVVRTLAKLFSSSTLRYPEFVRGLVDSIFIGKQITFQVDICPDRYELAVDSAILVVGGGVLNTLRRYYVATHQTLTIASSEELDMESHPTPIFQHGYWRITRGARASETLAHGVNSAVIERFVDSERSRIVLCCAGARADSSWAAVEYLVRHWRDLHRQFSDHPFAMVLEFPQGQGDSYLDEYAEPKILASVTG
jgi:hypothetical protein